MGPLIETTQATQATAAGIGTAYRRHPQPRGVAVVPTRGTADADWPLWSTRVRVVVTDPDQLTPAVRLVHEELRRVEEAVSRFHVGSELRELNAGVTVRWQSWKSDTGVQDAREDGDQARAGARCRQVRLVPISDTFAELMAVALNAAARTDGAVDPTIGASLRTLGYDRDIALVQAAGARVDADGPRATSVLPTPAPGWRQVRLHRRGDTWCVSLPATTELDLGATAKAAAADRCARLVADGVGCGVLVSIGGDLATAGASPQQGWQVDVADQPHDPPCRLTLRGEVGLATSSTRRRTWQWAGRRVHHVLDPASGHDAASPWGAVSVVAASCAAANAASTATIVAAERGLSWLRDTGLPARLVDDAGADVRLGSWPALDAAAASSGGAS